jgi:adenylate cyclase
MQVRLTEGEQARIRYTTTTNIDAWNLWIEGLRNDRLSRTVETRMKTRRCWEKALALDPGSAPLNAILADLHYSDARLGWSGEDHRTALEKAKAYVERALSIDPETPDAHRSAAGILLLEGRFEEAAEAARTAAKFGPSLPDLLASGGFVLTCCGYPKEAIPQMERALALSPVIQPGWHLGVLGNAYRLAGRGDDALTAFRSFHARNPGFGLVDIVLIQHQAGQHEEARETAAQLALARPDFTVAFWLRTQFRIDKAQMAADLASLRAAGVLEQLR